MISVSGLGLFTLIYSTNLLKSNKLESNPSFGYFQGLSGLITPSGFKRQFSQIQGLNVQRLMFHPWPDSPAPWIYEWTSSGHLSRFEWPTSLRRITTLLPQISLIVYDKVTIRWFNQDRLMNDRPGELDQADRVRMDDLASGFHLVYKRLFQGPLISSWFVALELPGVRTVHPNLGGLISAKFVYTYDSNMNVSFMIAN